jgi:glycerophosphoryl diester phosphodiesterase
MLDFFASLFSLDYTAEEAKQSLKFNKHFEEFGCGPEFITHPDDLATEALGQEPISHYCYVHTLEEVLVTLRDHPNVSPTLSIKIELKGEGTAAPSVQLVEKLNMMHRCHYSSFDHTKIAEVRALSPDAKTGALFANDVPDDFVQRAIAVGATEVHLKYDTCTYERIQAAHAAGLGTMAWFRGPIGMREDTTKKYRDVGNEDERMYEVVLRSGVRGMCVNRPDVMSKLADKLQRRIQWGSVIPQ